MRLISAPSTANDALNQARLSDKLQPFRYLPEAGQQLEDANKRTPELPGSHFDDFDHLAHHSLDRSGLNELI